MLSIAVAVVLLNLLWGYFAASLVRDDPTLRSGVPAGDFLIYRLFGLIFFPIALYMQLKVKQRA